MPALDHLKFSKTERNGIMVFTVILFLLLFIPWIALPYFTQAEKLDPVKLEQLIASTKKAQDEKNQSFKSESKSSQSEPFPFDPNTASAEVFKKLGLSSKTIGTIMKYRKKGGFFKTKEDFKKVYTLKDAEYLKLSSFIDIPASYKKFKEKETKEIEYFSFDPNTASKESLNKLGLQPRVVQTLINFRSKGGKFYKKEDLKKIYGLSEENYAQLAPHINIAPLPSKTKEQANFPESDKDLPKKKQAYIKENKPVEIVSVAVNSADEMAFQKIRGIGPAFSQRIIKFRKALGGFHSIEQIGETYGLPDSTFQSIKSQLILDDKEINQLDINQASKEVLQKHPYINFKEAKAITLYREKHPFESLEDLQKLPQIKGDRLKKMMPYLVVR